jgi:hypothetical protein
MHIQTHYKQGLRQSRLSAAGHSLSLVAHGTTAVSLEQLYACLLPSVGLCLAEYCEHLHFQDFELLVLVITPRYFPLFTIGV